MLRRATTALHPLCQRLQNATHRSLSTTTRVLSLPERKPENPSSPSAAPLPPLSSSSESSEPEVEHDASDATARTSDKGPTPTNHGRGRGRTRSLRPILIPPNELLLPVHPVIKTSYSSSSDQNNIETDPSSSATTARAVTLTGLPPDTVKTDIRPVFHRFGEITRIYIQRDGRRAEVVFADDYGVKRTLHAYAEKPLLVRGKEITVFRKQTTGVNRASSGMGMDASSRTSGPEQGLDGGAIFVGNFPPKMTQEELFEALAPFGKYEKFVMRPGSRSGYFVYSDDERVKGILSVHRRIPITVRGQMLRIERPENTLYSMYPGPLADTLELGKQLDPATASETLKDLKRWVTKFRGSRDPSRVVWIGGLPYGISPSALTNFWSRLGCVVDVRATLSGYAYVEFASIDDALHAVRQGAPHGFRYKNRLLDVDFAPWEFHVGPTYRVVYISGWPGLDLRPAFMRWVKDIPNVLGGTVLPPFRGEKSLDPRGAFLRFRTIDDARVALRMLHGRVGLRGETLHVGLTRLPVVGLQQMWRWRHEVIQHKENSRGGEGGEACLESQWGGLGFGTGREN